MAKHPAVETTGHLRIRRWCRIFAFLRSFVNLCRGGRLCPPEPDFGYVCRGRCPHRPVREEFAADFRENGAHCAGRCGHRPLQGVVENCNRPSIPEMSRNGIIAVCPKIRVVHLAEPKAIGKTAILRPNRAFRPRNGQKPRASARNMAHLQASLFAYFFWQNRKSMPAERKALPQCGRACCLL